VSRNQLNLIYWTLGPRQTREVAFDSNNGRDLLALNKRFPRSLVKYIHYKFKAFINPIWSPSQNSQILTHVLTQKPRTEYRWTKCLVFRNIGNLIVSTDFPYRLISLAFLHFLWWFARKSLKDKGKLQRKLLVIDN